MNLFAYIPEPAYSGEKHVADFQQAASSLLEQACAARENLFLQLRPGTATWGMEIYEREYGIPTDQTKPIAQRLARWRAKRRGHGTTTKDLLRTIAEGFSGGAVEVSEQQEAYLVVLYFSGTRGEPSGAADLAQSIREVLPAHLAFQLVYRYTTWGEADCLSWGGAEQYKWEELEVAAL